MKHDVYAGLNAMADECHRIAKEHGWWDNPPSFAETAMLEVTEIAEAVEEYRNHMPPAYVLQDNNGTKRMETDMSKWKPGDKPEGLATEQADCLIHILDWFGYMGYDLEAIMRLKCAYNETRTYRHNGKAL